MKLKLVIALAALSLPMVAAPASAQDQCTRFVGTTVTPTTIQAAMARFANVTPKGEFESTAAFEARIAQLTAGNGPLIIGKEVEDREQYLKYDADRGVLKILTYAFDNTNFSKRGIWGYGGPLYKDGDYTNRENSVDVVIKETSVNTGSFTGSNAFGVTRRITKQARTVYAIYDHPLKSYSEDSFASPLPDAVAGELTLSPAEARLLKATLKIAFVVVPQAPFTVSRTGYASDATISDPFEVTTTTKLLFADMQCALATDAGNKVLGAYPMK